MDNAFLSPPPSPSLSLPLSPSLPLSLFLPENCAHASVSACARARLNSRFRPGPVYRKGCGQCDQVAFGHDSCRGLTTAASMAAERLIADTPAAGRTGSLPLPMVRWSMVVMVHMAPWTIEPSAGEETLPNSKAGLEAGLSLVGTPHLNKRLEVHTTSTDSHRLNKRLEGRPVHNTSTRGRSRPAEDRPLTHGSSQWGSHEINPSGSVCWGDRATHYSPPTPRRAQKRARATYVKPLGAEPDQRPHQVTPKAVCLTARGSLQHSRCTFLCLFSKTILARGAVIGQH